MKKIPVSFILILVFIATLLITKNYLPNSGFNQSSPTPTPVQQDDASEIPIEATLSGEYTCLPHRDTNGPQTLECALGLKTAEGLYYSLDTQSLQQEIIDIPTGTIITVSGLLVPIEQISSDHWQKYNIEGIMKVENIEKN